MMIMLWIGLVIGVGCLLLMNETLGLEGAWHHPFEREGSWKKTGGEVLKGLYCFAAQSEGGEKTEKASHKKLQDARKKGQVPKSGDVNNFVTLLGAFGLLLFFGSRLIDLGKDKMTYYLANSYQYELLNQPKTLFLDAAMFFLNFVLFLFVPLMILGVSANLAQTGFLFTMEPLKPQFSKLNPISGFKEMFSRKRWFELLKNVLKLTLVTLVSLQFMSKQQGALLNLPYMGFLDVLGRLGTIVQGLMQQILLTIGMIAAADFGFQRFDFSKDMRMTKQEVKDEYKQMEGDPQMKGQRRQRQRDLLAGNLTKAVPEATVIVTNPTHFAVALKWEMDGRELPKVVAKGLDLRAQKIKELAKEHEVPMIENRPLARSLYKLVEVDDVIPPELFEAVSQVLAIVIRMQEKKKRKFQ